MSCPNTNLSEWKLLVASRGEDVAYALWDLYEGNVPESESKSEIVKSGLKATNILQSPKADQFFGAVAKNKITGDFFWRKMQADLGIPKDQLEILKSFDTEDKGELISSLLANYSYTIEINTAKEKIIGKGNNETFTTTSGVQYVKFGKNDYRKRTLDSQFEKISFEEFEKNKPDETKPTQYYSNLTVPGGTNYTENEIATPAITPSIKGHAQFATDNGIGWFRSDDKSTGPTYNFGAFDIIETKEGKYEIKNKDTNKIEGIYNTSDEAQEFIFNYRKNFVSGQATKTRRILEVQYIELFNQLKHYQIALTKVDNKARLKQWLEENKNKWANGVLDKVTESITKEELKAKIDDFYSKFKGDTTLIKLFLGEYEQKDEITTFFVKSIIQDSAKKGYEKVLFPTGNTASKVEGHTTLEEFKKQKEDRIKELETSSILKNKTVDGFYYIQRYLEDENGNEVLTWRKVSNETGREKNATTEEINQLKERFSDETKSEITQLKQELERVETEGFAALRPIYNFYENTVTNILNKTYGKENVKQITDEYGNTWNKVDVKEERDLSGIYFQTNDLKPSQKEASKIFFDEVYNKNLSELDVARINKKLKAISDRIGDETWQLRVSSSTGNYYVAGYKNKPVTMEGYYSPYANGIFRQTKDVLASRASKETIEKVKKLMENAGISLFTLQDYLKGNPDVNATGANALADLVQGIVAIAEGKEDVALTEEYVHVATAILEQVNPQLITNLIGKISQYKIYNIVLEKYKNNKAYQLANGKPDIRKIKKEAVDKLIAEMIINMSEGSTEFPELMEKAKRNIVQQMWDAILDAIRVFYKKGNVNLFEETAKQISEGNLGAGVEVLTEEGGVFFQLERNEQVDGAFNKFKEMNNRMNFVDATETEKRHYTYDGEKLPKTVTTLKGPKDIEQTPDVIAKKEWGTEGHNYLEQYIRTNLIDENGYALPLDQMKDVQIDSPLKEDVKKAVRTFAKELLASYKPGTRFLLESMVANLQTKEKIGSRIDFIAFEPIENSKGEPDVRIDILDWKFTSFDTERNLDVPYYSQKDWKEQMGEYTKIAYNLGIERNQLRKARMIPFLLNYRYAIKGNKASGLYPSSVEIGKIDNPKETNVYLLPVPVDFESTGNEKVDALLASLRRLYEKMYKASASPEEKFTKVTKLDQLSLAIRNLHLKLNFFPIYDVAVSFLNDVKNTIKEFEDIDYTILSKEQLMAKLQKIDEYQKSANKFIGLDEIYLSHISKEDMSPEDKKLLDNFGRVTIATKRALEQMLELQKAYVVQYAIKEGIAEEADDVLKAERVVSSLDKNFLETSKLAPVIIKLAAKVYLKAKNILNINFSKAANDYSKILIPLEEEARGKGKSAFEMIGRATDKGLRLIKKLDSEFLKQIKEAKEKENKQFLLDNLDIEKYKSLVDPIIQKTLDDLDRTQFSLNEEEDVQKREWRKQQIKNTLDITSKTFDGYKNFTFGSYYKKAMKEEGRYSSDYLEMSKSENALRVWQFFTALNEKAYKLGYLDKQGLSFFPLVEATTLQKMAQSGNILKESKDFFKDMYSINPNEEQLYAKTDDETGELKRMIPKYFTRTNKDVAQLSKDLNKVGLVWIKALMEYETTKELEYPLLTMHAVEQSKGTLITDTKGDVIFEGNTAKEREENENAMFFQSVLDDYLYGITENLNSMGNILMTSTASKLTKNQEKVEGGVISAKKVLKTGDSYLRTLALGLKPLLGIANFVGANVQSIISSSGIYDKGEFIKNVGKVMLPFNQGINLIERALIDTLVPLTGEDPLVIKQRLIAEKKSYTNYLSTWTFSDVMMTTNSFGEKRIELANALSMIDNAIVINGKILNAKQYLKAKDREAKKGMTFEERRALEKSFDERVKKLKEGDNTLKKLSKMVNDELVIEGVSVEELAKFRMAVIDNSRNITGQMSYDDKMGYRRDTLFNSFMMFKGWIPKQLSVRYKDITKNTATDEWEYGRFRVFFSTLRQIGIKNITDLRDIYLGNDKGLSIINEMLEEKKRAYFLKTGKELKITPEEYQDLIRTQINNMYKELALIFGILALLITSKIVAPDDDEDDLTKNRYKYFAKAINKISDELLFYVNPASADEMTRGSIIPSLGLFTKVISLLNALSKEIYYTAADDEKGQDKTYPLKYFINLIPIGSQFLNEILPLIDPELAKEMGIRVSAESRKR